jgi:hypothetical protein
MHLVLVAAAGGGFSTRRRRHAACFSFISSRRFYWSIAWQFEGKTACPSVFMNRRPTRRQSARFKVLPRIGTVQTNQWNLKENGKKTFLRNKRGWIFMLARGRFKKKNYSSELHDVRILQCLIVIHPPLYRELAIAEIFTTCRGCTIQVSNIIALQQGGTLKQSTWLCLQIKSGDTISNSASRTPMLSNRKNIQDHKKHKHGNHKGCASWHVDHNVLTEIHYLEI